MLSAVHFNAMEVVMSHLTLEGDNVTYSAIGLRGDSSLALTLDDTGTLGFGVEFLGLSGTTSVGIGSVGAGGSIDLHQLADFNNTLTTVTISGSEAFDLGSNTGHSNNDDGVVTDIAAKAASPTTVHSSLTLIDASATTGGVDIRAGATNTSSAGSFDDGASLNANVTVTYAGLTIKGGSGTDTIENDAKKGIVTEGNGSLDIVMLAGAGAKATLGTGAGDLVFVGVSELGTNEVAGRALGDSVKFGNAATAELDVRTGAEAGSTAGTTSIGLTKVLNAAAGMTINFASVTHSSTIADETAAVASSKTLAAAENAAVATMGSPGVAYFSFQGNEYFIATNNAEMAVSANDAVVELVGITNIHHAANFGGVVPLHV
jgi:hypothetical protein